jgi:hypothetical protein
MGFISLSIEKQIIVCLKEFGRVNRTFLVKQLKLARTTIFDNILKLIKLKFIHKSFLKKNLNSRGRPVVMYCLNYDKIVEINLWLG